MNNTTKTIIGIIIVVVIAWAGYEWLKLPANISNGAAIEQSSVITTNSNPTTVSTTTYSTPVPDAKG